LGGERARKTKNIVARLCGGDEKLMTKLVPWAALSASSHEVFNLFRVLKIAGWHGRGQLGSINNARN
jgi:hypothetical protein